MNSADLRISRKAREEMAASREFLGVLFKRVVRDHGTMAQQKEKADETLDRHNAADQASGARENHVLRGRIRAAVSAAGGA
jgi:hypothetical protein